MKLFVEFKHGKCNESKSTFHLSVINLNQSIPLKYD